MSAPPSLWRVFRVFFLLGATSIGGGVVGYLRSGLVVRQRWLDDPTFVELLSISQTLPGLNATNMSILVGDRLRGTPGALLAALGMCLPGASLMTAAAFHLVIRAGTRVSLANARKRVVASERPTIAIGLLNFCAIAYIPSGAVPARK